MRSKQILCTLSKLALLSACSCYFLSAASPKPAADLTAEPPHIPLNRLDKAWKRYHNPDLGYCVNYPARWTRDNAFDGTGLVIETGIKKYSKPIGEIDIGLVSIPTSEDARLKPVSLSASDSLAEDVKDHLEGLQKLLRAERVVTLDQHLMTMQGNAALFLKNKYYDPLERSNWTEEVVFVKRQGETFRLELQCQTDQLNRLEPIFANVLNTWQFDCK